MACSGTCGVAPASTRASSHASTRTRRDWYSSRSNPKLHARIQSDGAAGRVKKEYLAIVRGTPAPAQGSIALPLARSTEDRRLVIVTAAGQHSQTDYEVLSTVDGYSLVRCELVTGRTHQIRVHLAARGWPIAGDASYGEAHPALTRQALHAWRLTLPHPVTREPLRIEAPVPRDLQGLMSR